MVNTDKLDTQTRVVLRAAFAFVASLAAFWPTLWLLFNTGTWVVLAPWPIALAIWVALAVPRGEWGVRVFVAVVTAALTAFGLFLGVAIFLNAACGSGCFE